MKKNKKAYRRIRIYVIVIIGLLSFWGYKMYYYWPKIFLNYKNTEKYENEHLNLLEEEETLNNKLLKLQDPELRARFAREKYL